ncbi:MAG: hypothetical protein H6742_18175 [Alphaproteobacteria bacterium]|nr:hypothetical protein [Alphaproteobacteria bacterium]
MRPLLSLLLPAALLASPLAAAQDPSAPEAWDLTYDLRVGEQPVGTRTVTITFLPNDRRIIESYTELAVGLPGAAQWTMVHRASATTSAAGASFTSSVDENGTVREVQGRQRRDGSWMVSVVEGGTVRQDTVAAGRIDLSSLELLDPVRRRELTGRGTAGVLAAETGTLLSGPVQHRDEGVRTIGGQAVPVDVWTWTPESGAVTLSWSLDGVLVGYESAWMGKKLQAVLRDPPPRASLGDVAPVGDVIAQDVVEQEL